MIVTIIICVAVILILAFRCPGSRDSILGIFIICSFLTMIGIMLGVMLSIMIGVVFYNDYEYQYQCEQTELKAIQDRFGVQGSFFLGRYGSIDSESYYFFYRKENGGFRLDRIEAEKPIIYEYEEERKSALIKKCFEIKKVKGWLKYFVASPPKPTEPKYEIFIPKGTIKNIHNLDLE